MSRYLNLKNAHFITGGLTSDALRILEEGLTAWDRDKGIPSRVIKHNKQRNAPANFANILAGLVCEEGKGTEFLVCPSTPDPGIRFRVQFDYSGRQCANWFEAPLRFMLKGAPDITKSYTVYLHGIERGKERHVYYGISSRNWVTRFREHVSSAKAGSPLLFHKAIREILPTANRLVHCIIAAGLTKEQAYDAEEYLVDKYSLRSKHEHGLNILPGGFEGLRQLGRLACVNRDMSPEDRDAALDSYVRAHPLLGLPNPAVARAWEDDDYAEAVICGRENRLKAEQVRAIRGMSAMGHTIADIVAATGATSPDQVRRVLVGRTYGRIR